MVAYLAVLLHYLALAAITPIRDSTAAAFASEVVEVEEEVEVQEDLAAKNQEALVKDHQKLVFLVFHLLAQEKVNNLISWVDRSAATKALT